MNLAALSIRRPVFITCITLLLLVIGFTSLQKLGVDMYPSVSFPIVFVNTKYPGASPTEVETLVSRTLEDSISGLAGIKTIRSVSREGQSSVIVEFQLKTDIKFNLQQVRDRVAGARALLPNDVKEPQIKSLDPDDQAVVTVTLQADLGTAALFDLADQFVKPRIEQISQVGQIDVLGARKREIQVQLDRQRLRDVDVSALQVANQIAVVGKNIPAGRTAEGKEQIVYRTVAQFTNIQEIDKTVVRFTGNEFPVTVRDVGAVIDGLEEETSRTFVNGKPGLLLSIHRQSGANTIAVVEAVRKQIEKINLELKNRPGAAELRVVQDGSKPIRANVDDVEESILIGILLTVVVVWFFLGSLRATVVTGMALPTSLLGAFFLMSLAGFSINIMSLLALSLSVGLLIDDAIVVRENIFRHVELGYSAGQASILGTNQVALAVIATTSTVLAVFGPIGFLEGIVGQFFKEFGLTVCFAMVISLVDAMTIAPMLSAYLMGGGKKEKDEGSKGWFTRLGDAFQAVSEGSMKAMERAYARTLDFSVRHPWIVIGAALFIFFGSIYLGKYISKTFLPAQDSGEFEVAMDMPAGTSLSRMAEVASDIDARVRANREVTTTVLTVGDANGQVNQALLYVSLVPRKQRPMNTSDFKDVLRGQLGGMAGNAVVKDRDPIGGGMRPFNVRITGEDYDAIKKYAAALKDKLKSHPGLKDPDVNFRAGSPEFQVVIQRANAEAIGVASDMVGAELRTQVEGTVPAVFREASRNYDIRVRMKEDQRNLKDAFDQIRVPNLNGTLVPLPTLAVGKITEGNSAINREDRGRYVLLSADVAPKGPGMAGAMADINAMLAGKTEGGRYRLPDGMRFKYAGQAENFGELAKSMVIALLLGVLFIYLVLASLYESFITPFTIMLVLPLALCGALIALWMTKFSLDLFSMIGCIMLLGVATKNSILLVDRANQLQQQGKPRYEAMREGAMTRLRPILMTSFALVAGMIPIAIGLNEASSQRRSMGVALIGGLISSTLLSLVVIPAVWSTIDRFRENFERWVTRVVFRRDPDEKMDTRTDGRAAEE